MESMQWSIYLSAFGILIAIHCVYFFVIKKISQLSYRAAFVAGLVGCILWGVIYMIALGTNAQLELNVAVANILIEGTTFLTDSQNTTFGFLSQISPWDGNNSLSKVITPAFLEELGKILGLICVYFIFRDSLLKGRIQNTGTMIGVMAIIALGFSLIENVQYMLHISKNTYHDEQFLMTITSRSVLLPLVHMSFSLYSAYGFGAARFRKWELIDAKKVGLLKSIYKSRLSQTRYISSIIIVGFLISAAFHIVYNFLLEHGYALFGLIFSAGITIVFFMIITHLRKSDKYQTIKERIRREKKIKKIKKQR